MRKTSLVKLSWVVLLVLATGYSQADIRMPGPFFYGYVDKGGKEVIPCRYRNAMPFSEGLAAVSMIGEPVSAGAEKGESSGPVSRKGYGELRWGFIDKTGTPVIPAQFRYAGPFSDGLALVQRPGEHSWSYIDRAGNVLLTVSYRYAHDFSEGLAAVVGERMRNGFIDKSGKMVIEPRFHIAKPFREGLAAVELERKWGYINRAGEVVIEFQFEDATPFSDGVAAVRIGNACGYIDPSGKFVIPPQFGQARSFSEGLAPVRLARELTKKLAPFKEWAYIDRAGKIVIPAQFSDAEPFSEGLAVVKRGSGSAMRCEVIDRSGKTVWGARPVIGRYSEGLASVSGPLVRSGK
jgi:hypothetical protein